MSCRKQRACGNCTSSPRTHTYTCTPPSGTGLQLALSHNLCRPFLPDPPALHPQVEAALPTLRFYSDMPSTLLGAGRCSAKQVPTTVWGLWQTRSTAKCPSHAHRSSEQRGHIYRRNQSCTVDKFMDADVTWCSHLCLLGPFLPKGKVLLQKPLYPCTLRRAVGLPARGPALVEASLQGC